MCLAVQPDVRTDKSCIQAALAVMEEFRSAVQRHYVAFGGIHGRSTYDRLRPLFNPQHSDKTIFIGPGPPDAAAQVPGRSTIAQMTQGDFLAALSPGGEFENQHARALIVFVYHLWDEHFRPRVAKATGVARRGVRCSLMGDVRLVRNAIIHDRGVLRAPLLARLEILPRMWELSPGDLFISKAMMQSMMEQINALRVEIGANPS